MSDAVKNYELDIQAMLMAAHEWAYDHPSRAPQLRALLPSEAHGALVIGGLTETVIRAVSRDEETAALLRRMDKAATRGGATILQAEAVIEAVFGIPRALNASMGK